MATWHQLALARPAGAAAQSNRSGAAPYPAQNGTYRAMRRDLLEGSYGRMRSVLSVSLITRVAWAKHQDLSMTGVGPTVELFNDRVEVRNPGVPLLETLRLIDLPPRSRNEKMASFMRRIGMCEERAAVSTE